MNTMSIEDIKNAEYVGICSNIFNSTFDVHYIMYNSCENSHENSSYLEKIKKMLSQINPSILFFTGSLIHKHINDTDYDSANDDYITIFNKTFPFHCLYDFRTMAEIKDPRYYESFDFDKKKFVRYKYNFRELDFKYNCLIVLTSNDLILQYQNIMKIEDPLGVPFLPDNIVSCDISQTFADNSIEVGFDSENMILTNFKCTRDDIDLTRFQYRKDDLCVTLQSFIEQIESLDNPLRFKEIIKYYVREIQTKLI